MLTRESIDLNHFFGFQPASQCGALSTFAGIIRDHHEGRAVRKIFYDCYEALAEKELQRVTEAVKQAYPVDEVRVLHRIGELNVGEVAVAIAVTSPHRSEAFSACRMAIDEIKCRVPIWKKEFYVDGSALWVLCQHQADAGTQELTTTQLRP